MNKRSYQSGIRIIAGKHRGRKVHVLDASGLRPTPNRVRETVFNWLQNDIAHAHVLDAFAGSGIMGLESLSRGAASIYFIENNPTIATQLRHILQQWNERHARIHTGDALSMPPPTSPYDIIFLDPPFAAQNHQAVLAYFCQDRWLKKNGLIYIELPHMPDLLTLPRGYVWHKLKQAGRLYFGLIKRQENDE